MRASYLERSIAVFAAAMAACGGDSASPQTRDDELRDRFDLQPIGTVEYPADNQRNTQRIALGRLLFFDPILGGEQDVSCGTCHHPDFDFADGRQFGAGVSGIGLGPNRNLGVSRLSGEPISTAARNTPTILNSALIAVEATDQNGKSRTLRPLFWDGRATSLENQALFPIGSRVEMRGDAFPGIEINAGYPAGSDLAAHAAVDSILLRLNGIPEYVALFQEGFAGENVTGAIINRSTLARAIAAYEREIVAVNSPFDRWVAGDDAALTELQKEGLELFYTKASCATCHGGPMFSNFNYFVTGVAQEGPGLGTIPGDDLGREEQTGNPVDRFRFRVPSLRNVALTAPYMHDGVFETLTEVVEFFNRGCEPRRPDIDETQQSAQLRAPLGLTDGEVAAIVSFLESLTDSGDAIDPLLSTVPPTVPSGLTPVFGMGGR